MSTTSKYILQRLSLLFFGLSVASIAHSQAPLPLSDGPGRPVNYLRTWIPLKAITNAADLTTAIPVTVAGLTTQYYDGLGRLQQTVVKEGSKISGQSPVDLISPVIYDDQGRETYKYLPYASTATDGTKNNGLYKIDALLQQSAFYSATDATKNPIAGQGETFFYSQSVFEGAPVNRVIEQYAPGNSWVGTYSAAGNPNSHSVKMRYWTNTALDEVRSWNVVDGSSGNPTSYTPAGIFTAGQLFKSVIIDEHGKQVIEFKDKHNMVVLRKVQHTAAPDNGAGSNHTGWLCTYYLYDDFNNLRCMIQPRGVELISQLSWQLSDPAILGEQCFRYEYDQRHQLIRKKIPGAGEEYLVYDKMGRVVFTQDANMHSTNQWMTNLYDDLNRPVLTGLTTYSGSQSTLQQLVNTLTAPGSGTSVTIDGVVVNKNPIPSGSTFRTLSITFYDNYTWTSRIPVEYRTFDNSMLSVFYPAGSSHPYPQTISPASNTHGLVTGTIKKTIDGTQELVSTIFYDEKGRTIQQKASNITGACDIVTTQYSFTGLPLMNYLQHRKNGSNLQQHNIITKYEYDELGRMITVRKSVSSNIGGQIVSKAEQIVVSNEYDALGQLKKKTLGSAALEETRYDYNIHGKLLGANRDYAKDVHQNNYFGFDLGYDKTSNGLVGNQSYTAAQFNGNITGTVWKSKGDGEKRKYDYKYDAVNRLMSASFTQYTTGSFSTAAGVDFSLRGMSYDANGNIITLNQSGWKLGGSAVIDSLLYNYENNGNRLKNVIDRANDPQTKLGDFRSSSVYMTALSNNKTNSAVDYSYDANGNLIRDRNKDIGDASNNGISYNFLNLPEVVTVRNAGGTVKGTLTYTYDAAGNKLKTLLQEAGKPSRTTLFIAGLEYVNDTLQFMSQEEGRIRLAKQYFQNGDSATKFQFDYFLKDHLGNIRMVITEQKDTMSYLASMETSFRTKETALFSNIAETAYPVTSVPGGYPSDPVTNPNQYVSKLNGSGRKVGPSLILKVMSGDKVDIGVKYLYRGSGTAGSTSDPLADILSALAGGIVGVAGESKGSFSQLNNSATSPLTGVLNSFFSSNNSTPANKPKAYLNWMLLDEQLNLVNTYPQSGAIPVGDADQLKSLGYLDIDITKNGFLYVYVSNETQNWDVFFDNLSVTHYPGPMLEETHYYPFGLPMAGISHKAIGKIENKYKFNGTQLNEDIGINIYETFYRSNDFQIGRWWQVDPKSEVTGMESPYNAFGNNPVSRVDPMGDDWYERTTSDGLKIREWFPGNEEREGWINIGEYFVYHFWENSTYSDLNPKIDKAPDADPTLIIFHQTELLGKIDLGSDLGKKFKMLLAEGGFNSFNAFDINKKGRGVEGKGGGHRETYFGLLLISASMDNRLLAINNPENANLMLSKYWGSGKDYESLFKPAEYNGTREAAYKNYYKWYSQILPQARSSKDIFTLIADAYRALNNPGATLQLIFKFDASCILAYAHNNAGTQLYKGESIPFDKTKTLIQVLNTRRDIKVNK